MHDVRVCSLERKALSAVFAVIALFVLARCSYAEEPPAKPGAPTPALPQPAQSDPGQYWFELAQVHQRFDAVKDAEECYSKAVETAKSAQLKTQALAAWSSGGHTTYLYFGFSGKIVIPGTSMSKPVKWAFGRLRLWQEAGCARGISQTSSLLQAGKPASPVRRAMRFNSDRPQS